MNRRRGESEDFLKLLKNQIENRVSVMDYFIYLENQGRVKFDRKTGHDFYFRTPDHKYSVTNSGYYDFKNSEGGGVIKAVMNIENKSWREALEFLKDFSVHIEDNNILKPELKLSGSSEPKNQAKVIHSTIPNNDKLISYFEKRGISKDTLQQYTQQLHYIIGGKRYFGIAIENISGGHEVRNSLAKTKIGKSDISVIKGRREDEVIVFEGMTDMLSFIQLQKNNDQGNNRTLVCLNSVTNVDKFINEFQNFPRQIFLCLDGDEAGDYATEKILNDLMKNNIKDIRPFYNLSKGENNDLNDYLRNRLVAEKENLVIQSVYQKERSNEEGYKRSR
ncbi:toprim domain-containing protein [Chryseobacterium potabilaquae]|uniref:DNA primase n=1 Tax=Chryseobacterium potabilaquae TaxID=2675057 RepID=A0A6N4XBG0_9FLAO|nr:toprim domain-containing protein [Chryseobacterium potabilaquae]CAA7196986.1 DNA primase [Chryseobacterium potabilaquae]